MATTCWRRAWAGLVCIYFRYILGNRRVMDLFRVKSFGQVIKLQCVMASCKSYACSKNQNNKNNIMMKLFWQCTKVTGVWFATPAGVKASLLVPAVCMAGLDSVQQFLWLSLLYQLRKQSFSFCRGRFLGQFYPCHPYIESTRVLSDNYAFHCS